MSDALTFDVKGQVVVITGGTGVLGGAMANGLAKAGMRVAVLGRSEEKGKLIVQEIEQGGGEAQFVPIDVMSADSCQDAAAKVVEAMGDDRCADQCGGWQSPERNRDA